MPTPALSNADRRRGLWAMFVSTFFQLCGVFMMIPLLLILLKRADVSNTVAGLFAATNWMGIFLVTPFASTIAQHLGRRNALWLASVLPLVSALGFWWTDSLGVWFVMMVLAGAAGGMRWVLSEAFIAEFAPPEQIGRYIGLYATMVGGTLVVGPLLLAAVGSDGSAALASVAALLSLGLLCSAWVPAVPPDADEHSARTGPAGLWQALRQNPVIMVAGFIGGYFELGLGSILPLYGLALSMPESQAALLVALSGAGGTLAAMPAGLVADRFANPQHGRRRMMQVFTASVLLASLATLAVPHAVWLVWPVVALWGAAGGTLYTLSMIDIGAREKGVTLVNSTAVLVLTYTMGGLVSSSLSGALLDWSLQWAFPLSLVLVAAMGLVPLLRNGRKRRSVRTGPQP